MPVLALPAMKLLALVTTFATVAYTTYWLLKTRTERQTIRSGMDDALLSSPAVAESRSAVLRLPFAQRILGPTVRKLAGLVYRFGPKGLRDVTKKRLVLAGMADRVDPDTFYALSALFPVIVAAFIFTYRSIGTGGVPLLGWLLIPASAFFPKIWLTNKVESRQHKIRLALADTLDLLTIAVEAGLGFDAALARVVGAIRGPLSDELYRMLQELRIGIPRVQAFRNLSERTDVSELDQFITAMNQADAFGISVARILRVQAAQLRVRRSQLAEERAAKTPVKLLFPLILCIFPALFTVLVGPAAINIMQNLFTQI